jgi:hypothetical protein
MKYKYYTHITTIRQWRMTSSANGNWQMAISHNTVHLRIIEPFCSIHLLEPYAKKLCRPLRDLVAIFHVTQGLRAWATILLPLSGLVHLNFEQILISLSEPYCN